MAHECGHYEIELVVGIYAMAEQNTPGAGAVLGPAHFVSIPEAHCYLRLGEQRYDFTGLHSGRSSLFDALLSEHTVSPMRLPEEKAKLHHKVLHAWAIAHELPFTEAWALREACIKALASHVELP